jgi:hypothetical protein
MAVSEPASGPIVAAYLAAVTGVGVATIVVLYRLFVSGFPEFLERLGDDPAAAVQSDPLSPALVLAGLVLPVVLVALVVAFGARHGPAAIDENGPENHRGADEE